ncbi:MAG: hypothetical protein WC717_03225 [Candidatus Micrarchaeia archaeon]
MRSWHDFQRFKHDKLSQDDKKHPAFKHLEDKAFDTCFWAREEHAYKLLGSLIDWTKAREYGLGATTVMYPTRDNEQSNLSSPLLFVIDKQKKGIRMAFLREDSFHHGYAPYHSYAHYSHLGKKYTISYPADLFSEYNTSNSCPDRWLSAFFTQFTFRDRAPETYHDAGISITIPSHHSSMSLVLKPSATGEVELGMTSIFDAPKKAASAAFMKIRGEETPRLGHYIFTFEGKSYLIKEDGEVDYLMTNTIELHKKFLDKAVPAHAQAEKILRRFFARAQRIIVKTSEACGAEKIADLFQSLRIEMARR